MRIAIVNDSPMAVEVLRRIVVSDSRHAIAWTAADGAAAVRRCAEARPELILMDLVMPVLDGVSATRQIMSSTPCAILIITATVKGNSARVFEAMGAGALDALSTPVLNQSGLADSAPLLLQKIAMIEKLLFGAPRATGSTVTLPARRSQEHDMPLLALGASTGGPAALAHLLSALPSTFTGAVVIAQHMEAQFLPSFVAWLGARSALPLCAVRDGDVPQPGTVMVATGADHLILDSGATLRYRRDPADYPYRPSVNVWFESVAAHWKGPAAAVLLTGMGRDGAAGLLALRQRGFLTIAQDESTSAVFGMPKAAIALGAAAEVLPLPDIAPCIVQALAPRRR